MTGASEEAGLFAGIKRRAHIATLIPKPDVVAKLMALQNKLTNDAIKCVPHRGTLETWKALLTGKRMGCLLAADYVDELIAEIEEGEA